MPHQMKPPHKFLFADMTRVLRLLPLVNIQVLLEFSTQEKCMITDRAFMRSLADVFTEYMTIPGGTIHEPRIAEVTEVWPLPCVIS